jgi:hypothetical protein
MYHQNNIPLELSCKELIYEMFGRKTKKTGKYKFKSKRSRQPES